MGGEDALLGKYCGESGLLSKLPIENGVDWLFGPSKWLFPPACIEPSPEVVLKLEERARAVVVGLVLGLCWAWRGGWSII